MAGRDDTRIERIPGNFWALCAVAGVAGAVLMGLYMMASTATLQMGWWVFPNLVGATLPAYRPPVGDFAGGMSIAGLGLHLIIGAVFGMLYGAIAASLFPWTARNWGPAFLLGLAYGALVWSVMVLAISPMFSPFINLAPPYNLFYGHLFFGLITALAVCAWERRRHIMVTFFPEAVAEEEREEALSNEHRWI